MGVKDREGVGKKGKKKPAGREGKSAPRKNPGAKAIKPVNKGVVTKEVLDKRRALDEKEDVLQKEGPDLDKSSENPQKDTSKPQAAGQKGGIFAAAEDFGLSKNAFIAVIIATLAFFGLFYAIYTEAYSNGGQKNKSDFPYLSDEAMVCGDYYVCFLNPEGQWQRPPYSAGTNLTVAYMLSVSNEAQIRDFFKSERINIVVSCAEGPDAENSQMILAATPFSYYLSHYFISYKGENKSIEPYTTQEYSSSEPAIYIYGPNTLANETALRYDGKNIIVQGETYPELSLILGKLIIMAIEG
jgi:hypothetical protein